MMLLSKQKMDREGRAQLKRTIGSLAKIALEEVPTLALLLISRLQSSNFICVYLIIHPFRK